MTHPELCRLTAEKFVKKARLALWEYQSFASQEFPDVLVFHSYETTLYEIKMSRADFLADSKKSARVKWHNPVYWHLNDKIEQIEDRIRDGSYRPTKEAVYQLSKIKVIPNASLRPEKSRVQAPHLGVNRFFVCPEGMILKEEIPEGWGLYWFKDGRFFKKKDSGKFRPDVWTERNLVSHAMQRLASGNLTGIIVNTFGNTMVET